jgi:hypothetical protein
MSASEKMLQTHAVSALIKLQRAGHPILYAGSMEGQRRTPAEALWAKNTGMTAGEPDLRVYARLGRILFIELKTSTGRLRPEQVERHKALRGIGHRVEVLRAETGEEMAQRITALVLEWLLEWDANAAAQANQSKSFGEGGEASQPRRRAARG